MNNKLINYCSQSATGLQQKLLAIVLLSILLSISSCGSGSALTTSSKNDLPTPVAGGINGDVLVPLPKGQEPAPADALELLPKISLSQRQFADPNVLLNLGGTAVAAADATIVKTLWTQVTGPQVRIPSPLSLANEILITDVNIATQLEFRLTAEDSKGRVNSATMSVLIKPLPIFVKVIGGVFDENQIDKQAVFTLRLNAPSSSPVTITYSTQNGTANSGTDYEFTSGEVVLAAGEVSKTIAVKLINDTVAEADENFSLHVTAIDGTTTYANSGVAIIHNGSEPQLQQTIQFSRQGPARIYLDQQFSNPLDTKIAAPGTGNIIYSSSNPAIASINAQGAIIILAVGTTEITASKLADDNYREATASFTLHVSSRGASSGVRIEQGESYFIQPGEQVNLVGLATDPEDGPLPTQQQIADSAATGTPISSLTWTSDLDGALGFGSTFNTKTLTQGKHIISYQVTDSDGNISSASIRVFVLKNIAPLATTKASSTYCHSEDCYSTTKINDGDLSTTLGHLHSWVNDDISGERWVSLTWQGSVTINKVDLYTSERYIIQDYDIEYFDGNKSWIPVVSVTKNTQLRRSHPINEISTTQLRVVVRNGSIAQSIYGRVNELMVFGIAPPKGAPDMSFSSTASSVASSSRANSSLVSSSVVRSSTVTASVISSSPSSSSLANVIKPLLAQQIQFSDPGPVSVVIGKQYTNPLDSAVVAPGIGNITYLSSDPLVANVSAKGVITALRIGTTKITVTKAADAIYLAANNSFTLQVVSNGASPQVSIKATDGYSPRLGETVSLVGVASDQEDGVLPTQQQIVAAKDLPRWQSDVDGPLNVGNTLNTGKLTMGTHAITYSATDSDGNTSSASIRVLAGNLAPLAYTIDSSLCDDVDCYWPSVINDTNLSTAYDREHSWVNNNPEGPKWVSLIWEFPITISKIDLYTAEGHIIQDYDIEYLEGNDWVPMVSISKNMELYRSHTIDHFTTRELRLVVRNGSIAQPNYGSVNELVVYGTPANGPSSVSSISILK